MYFKECNILDDRLLPLLILITIFTFSYSMKQDLHDSKTSLLTHTADHNKITGSLITKDEIENIIWLPDKKRYHVTLKDGGCCNATQEKSTRLKKVCFDGPASPPKQDKSSTTFTFIAELYSKQSQ